MSSTEAAPSVTEGASSGKSSVVETSTSAPESTQALPATGASIPEVKIDAVDFSYTGPDTLSAGWVKVTLTNDGQEWHHVQFMRLNDGVTLDQFNAAAKQSEAAAMALVTLEGGVGQISHGETASAIINLPAGQYVILCLVPSPSDNVPHFAKGMIKAVTVEPSTGQAAAEPEADLTVHLKDYSFDLPDTLPAGETVIKVVNEGPENHEFNIVRLADGKTVDDLKAFLMAGAAPASGTEASGTPMAANPITGTAVTETPMAGMPMETAPAGGPPPFNPVGGLNALAVGNTGYAIVNLPPGNYAAICYVPSPKAGGEPHFMLGMIQAFTVK